MKYKINRNPEPFTEGEIASGKNFSKALGNYRAMKIPFYRRGRFLTSGSAVIVAAAIALVVLFADRGDEPRSKPFIAPPLVQADIPVDTFTVDADSTTEIDYRSGSKLHVPAGAFLDTDSNVAKGRVTLRYREFHDQKDIFLSGIPMTYDSAGTDYVFESAGMMEITAWQDGRPLAANPGHPITVDMVSNTAEDKYNTYYLDTTARKWINLNQANLDPKQFEKNKSGADSMGADGQRANTAATNPVLQKCEQEVKKTEAAVKECEKEKPIPVVKADNNKTRFHIVADMADFPELASYRDVKFQVKDEEPVDKTLAQTVWGGVRLRRLSGMDYEVTFIKGSKIFKVIATPVIEEKDMAAATAAYDKKYTAYQTVVAERKVRYEAAKKEYAERAEEFEAQMRKDLDDERQRLRVYEAKMAKINLVYRTFSVYRFGTYNCDCPLGWPNEAIAEATFRSEDGKKLSLGTLNLVEKGRNAIFPYYAYSGECENFRYNGSKDNMLWGMTADNKLATVDVKSFREAQGKGGKIEFRFRVTDKDFKSSDEIKKYLEI